MTASANDKAVQHRCTVSGTVRYQGGNTAPGIRVAAFDRDLRNEEFMGEAQTDRNGAYEIEYSSEKFLSHERGTADLVLRAYDEEGKVLVASPILFNAGENSEVDLTIPPGRREPPSLYEQLKSTLEPLLGDLSAAELDESDKRQDLSFLAGETGYEQRLLARFALAHRMARRTLETEFWFALLGSSFFAYSETKSLEQNLLDAVDALPIIDEAAVRKALAGSFARRDISTRLRGRSDEWIRAFEELNARSVLGKPTSPTFVRLALQDAGIENPKTQLKFARLFNQHKGLAPDLVTALEKDRSFRRDQIENLRTSYQLADLTRGDFEVVKALKDEFNIRRPEQIRGLAKVTEREWVDFIERKHAAGEIDIPIDVHELEGIQGLPEAEVYAKGLNRQFRGAFPTAAFQGGLERALKNGGTRGMKRAKSIGQVLERHPEFDLLRTPVDEFLGKDIQPALRSLGDNPDFRVELKAVQRVFKLAPTFEATDALLADGIHSAQMVYRLGESEFVRRYKDAPGFTVESAHVTWNRAAETHAAVLTLIGDLKALDPETLPQVLNTQTQALAKFPNWENLFQSGDVCNCEQCRSVLSPAAYFADLLMFLRDRKAANPAFTAKDILFKRRPDLGYLELNCENALTTLPYIDVVCEVLERVVAPGEADIELAAFAAMPAGSGPARAAVAAALTAAAINIGTEFTISQVDTTDPNRWVVHGEDATYLLKKKATPNFFGELLPNTKAESDELRAYPAYVDAKAYLKLRQARFPLALPFDLFAEEVRAAFAKCNLQRWDLMRTGRGPAAPNDPADGDIAAEYFGISSDPAAAFDEKRLTLIADATAAGQQAVWGETGNAGWLNTVGNVKAFLQKSGLEYEQLLALLDLPFINPNADIVVHHLDGSCDTDKKVIQGLDAAKLDRIHRFLRMWRKLNGWQLWELDLAIRCSGIGAGSLDEPFLINLYYLGRLRSRLGAKTTVAELCALIDNLGTETHFTQQYEHRSDGLYQKLFLNRKLVQPLDPAFHVAAVNVPQPTVEKISGHRPVVLAALGLRDADLNLLTALTRASNGVAYISDDLTLGNLSFLWRHAWLAKLLKVKPEDWKIALKLLQEDVLRFADAKAAWEFVDRFDQLRPTGLTADELNWVLAADRTAVAATKETDASRFLTSLRARLQAIRTEYDPATYEFLSPPADPDRLIALLTSLLQQLHRSETEAQFFIDVLRDEVQMEEPVAGLPPGFDFPAAIKNAIRISYDEPATKLRCTSWMTPPQRNTLLTDPTLAAVTGIASYQDAIEGFFQAPRLALKFLDPVFSAQLSSLPAAVDFTTLPDPVLAQKISYDTEERTLSVVGVLTAEQKNALDGLSADPDYRNAVNTLFTQPTLGVFPPERLWLQEADLQFPLRDLANPANDKLNENLATAVQKGLAFLSKTLSDTLVIQQASAQLGLTEGVTRRLLGQYAILPETLLVHMTASFATTSAVVDYTTLPATFNGWFWAVRVAALWKKWKLTLDDWERIRDLTAGAQLLDPLTVPLDATKAVAPFDRFARTCRLIRLRDALPEERATLLEVLWRLNRGVYIAADASDFAADVELVNKAWSAEDVKAMVASLDLAYPNDYLLAENLERLRRNFYFVDNLNAKFDTVKTLAAAAMTDKQAKTVKELLRSKLGSETWLTLSVEIQDALRERKRDALAAYLLAQPKPADAPTGKWENTNDLYAYYLLDVEMGSCQLTSRLVQASGSIQLFVQRCFMGLEPDIKVHADGPDGDSAWRWWKWMRKYRVWEANRKVFLWPENWIEPELKKDRSPFFKDLEKELLQNELNQYTVETAYTNYLEKLNGVAQLEIAGFYQEDDGDDTIIHVFGRTTGAEPHTYYYRRYDYRQWTPWEKVDLDIQGDYLVPAVVNNRLFLFWPVFTEVPSESENSTVSTPAISQTGVKIQHARKKFRLQLALSDYRQGKWTPKRVSKDFAESSSFNVDLVRKRYAFFTVDRSAIDGRFGVKYFGSSVDSQGNSWASLSGSFEITGCDGVPDIAYLPGHYRHVERPEWASVGDFTSFLKWEELPLGTRDDRPDDDFTLQSALIGGEKLAPTSVLGQTPDIFKMSPPWHLSYMDRLLNDLPMLPLQKIQRLQEVMPAGAWLPFFYNDKNRTFFVLPALSDGGRDERERLSANYATFGTQQPLASSGPSYYPDVKKAFQQWENFYEGKVETWVDSIDLGALKQAQRNLIEATLHAQVASEVAPPFTDAELRELLVRFFMRFFHYWLGTLSLQLFERRRFHFKNFYHPFVCDFARTVYNPLKGVPGLLTREVQLQDDGFSFARIYRPTWWVIQPGTDNYYPREIVDFSPDGAYSGYNWELFFHAPLLIANALSKNQRFEEARDWYHFIFNPIGVESKVPGGSAMSKYWITKPFFETTDPQYVQQRIENILRLLAGDTTIPGYSLQAKQALEEQVRDWRTYPFEPHRIANYRTVAYQKTVVMKYLDNLIAWGDYLFRQDSMESINEATQLYILAAELLGPQPKKIPPAAKPPLESFNELEKQLDAFSNALIEVENLVPVQSGSSNPGPLAAPLPMLYFCIPRNEKMLGYWDTVADRLYKIRNCMNIEGVVRQLALFEPPIDPAALVKAVAAGLDIGAALADLNAPLPVYRFNVLLQKANEVCSDVKGLGAALLSALEKKDGEALSLLRQGQEIQVLEAVKGVKETQLDEAKENLKASQKAKELAEIKRSYYDSRDFMSPGEIVAITLSSTSTAIDAGVALAYVLSGGLKTVPQFLMGASGFGGSPHATLETGGKTFGSIAEDSAMTLESISRALEKGASIANTVASYSRRQDEWDFQTDLAAKELEQIDRQIASAELRVSLAEKELENHDKQIENAKATDAFMRSKYTNEELFQWQIGEISRTYFQSYKLAYDLAKCAELCLRFELGLQDSNFVSFGYWDSLKKGLLSGERLQYDLRRMESGYLEQNRREFELTKHVSIVQLDPLALVRLRETGRCFFRLPEELFDLDYPGHYFRRIKSVSLTIPCVAGPYTTISCTLRLLKNSLRVNTKDGDNGYPRNTNDAGMPVDDDRFIESNAPVKAVATSSGQNDSGVFELSFRDERYLPFEGAGALSEWAIELFSDLPSNNPDPAHPDFGQPLRQFDYGSISDAVVHVKYTAREDAGVFKNGAVTHLRDYLSRDGTAPSLLALDLRREFATEWSRFLSPVNPAAGNVFEFEMSSGLFPLRDAARNLKVNSIAFLARCTDPANYTVTLTPPLAAPPPIGANAVTLAQSSTYGGLHFGQKDVSGAVVTVRPSDPVVKWRIKMVRPGGGNLSQDPTTHRMEVEDAVLVLGYQWE